ncbi:trichohyalin-like [Mya arenaria]|uniref:trichohyalin-like n=1 Tax=Mya arenaria TaxID=6604 RepID=UPI0022E79BCB|nr:trichohyalin-like [Mya arenaria]
MVEGLSEREKRLIRRNIVRDTELSAEPDRMNIESDVRRRFSESKSYVGADDHGAHAIEMDRLSDISDLNTIDEYFHESTSMEIRAMERSVDSKTRVKENLNESNLKYLDDHYERLEQTLRELRYDGDLLDQKLTTEPMSKYGIRANSIGERGEIEKAKRLRHFDDLSETKLKGSYKDFDMRYDVMKDVKHKSVQNESPRDLKTEIRSLRMDQGEIKSQSSRYERESLKLKQLQMEEDRKQRFMMENRQRLNYEMEMKRKAEHELVERIKILEQQELELNKRRNENERIERDLEMRRENEEELNHRLILLKEKEQLLLDKADNRKTEFNDRNKKKEERLKGREHKAESVMYKVGSPKIPNFNGKHFEQWKVDVCSILESNAYPDHAVVQAIRNSLQGDVRQVLLTLKPTASAETIVNKLKEVYGNVKTGDRVVTEFYSAKQKEGESCSSWGVRVETLFQQAVEKGEIDEEKRDKKLKERFWRGLRSEKLRMTTRVAYESKDSFECLRRKARSEEEEENSEVREENTRSAYVNQIRDESGMKELLERLKSMEIEMKRLKGQSTSYRGNNYNSNFRRPFRGGYRGGNRGFRGRSDDGKEEQIKETEKGPEQNEKSLNEKKLSSGGTMEAKK